MTNTAYEQLNIWLETREVPCQIMQDKDGAHAYFIFKEHRGKAQHIDKYAKRVAKDYGMYSLEHSDRTGTLLILSENRVNEDMINYFIDKAYNEYNDFYKTLDEALSTEVEAVAEEDSNKPAKPRLVIDLPKPFKSKVDEALDGIATPTNMQPKDGLQSLAQSLKTTGLGDALKKMGVSWHIAKPGMHKITFIKNEVPIYEKEASSLATSKDLQTALSRLQDIASGRAPGSSEEEKERLKARENQAAAIAKQFAKDGAAGQQQIQ